MQLSSPHAKRAGPKGLRAESARAVTGRRCPHSGKGEDFLTGQLNFFTETAVTSEQKVDFWTKNRNFGSKKRRSLFRIYHVLATTGKNCSKKKSAFAQIIKGGNVILGDFLG